MEIGKFYNKTASFYDEMINPLKLIGERAARLKTLINNDEVHIVADLGCGTGNDTIALSLNDIKATGFDASPEMIKIARQKAEVSGKDMNFVCSEIKNISRKYNNNFDVAISLGNTFANIPKKEIPPTFKKINTILKSKGKFIFQILNYNLILKKKERIINITESDTDMYIRFYDFHDEKDLITFNILKFRKSDFKNYEIIATEIFPHSIEFLKDCLKKYGFKNINLYQDMEYNKFNRVKSKDIYIICEKK